MGRRGVVQPTVVGMATSAHDQPHAHARRWPAAGRLGRPARTTVFRWSSTTERPDRSLPMGRSRRRAPTAGCGWSPTRGPATDRPRGCPGRRVVDVVDDVRQVLDSIGRGPVHRGRVVRRRPARAGLRGPPRRPGGRCPVDRVRRTVCGGRAGFPRGDGCGQHRGVRARAAGRGRAAAIPRRGSRRTRRDRRRGPDHVDGHPAARDRLRPAARRVRDVPGRAVSRRGDGLRGRLARRRPRVHAAMGVRPGRDRRPGAFSGRAAPT